jgi:hypothetical protein
VSLLDKVRDQLSAAGKHARGVSGITVPSDPDITYTELPPGTGMLRTTAQVCEECWSLVLTARKAEHTDWHRALLRTIISPPMLDAEESTATRGRLPVTQANGGANGSSNGEKSGNGAASP